MMKPSAHGLVHIGISKHSNDYYSLSYCGNKTFLHIEKLIRFENMLFRNRKERTYSIQFQFIFERNRTCIYGRMNIGEK